MIHNSSDRSHTLNLVHCRVFAVNYLSERSEWRELVPIRNHIVRGVDAHMACIIGCLARLLGAL
jgi:hypothetical protein